jgi:tetratricopeptide (TPR) repeat protein
MHAFWSFLINDARPFLLVIVIAPVAMIVINLVLTKIRAKIDPYKRNMWFRDSECTDEETIQKILKMSKEMGQIDTKDLSPEEQNEKFKALEEKYGLKDYFEKKRKERDALAETIIRAVSERIAHNSARWQDYVDRAGEYMYKKRWNEAIADWTKVILLKPRVEEAYFGRSCAYFEIKEYKRAYADAQKIADFLKKKNSHLLDEIKKAMQLNNPQNT